MVDFGAGDLDLSAFLVLDDLGHAVYLRDNGLALGRPGFEKLFDPGQTAGDIQADHAAGMEGAQGQLGARFADALGGDDADGDIVFNQLAAGKVAAVAAGRRPGATGR